MTKSKAIAISNRVDNYTPLIALVVYVGSICAVGFGFCLYGFIGEFTKAWILFCVFTIQVVVLYFIACDKRMGVTRYVILTDDHAIKLPQFRYGWKNFLCGLLANMQEREFSKTRWPELCPVTFSIPYGWLVVMRRARPLSRLQWTTFKPDAKAWRERGNYFVPVELKRDSFGYINNSIVAIDYGGYMTPKDGREDPPAVFATAL